MNQWEARPSTASTQSQHSCKVAPTYHLSWPQGTPKQEQEKEAGSRQIHPELWCAAARAQPAAQDVGLLVRALVT